MYCAPSVAHGPTAVKDGEAWSATLNIDVKQTYLRLKPSASSLNPRSKKSGKVV